LAQIEDLGKHPDLLKTPGTGERLISCASVIRKSLFEKAEPMPGSSHAGFLDTLDLKDFIDHCWKIVKRRSFADNVELIYRQRTADQKPITLEWPRLYCRHVLEGVIESAVSLVREELPSHADAGLIEINAYRWDSDVHLTIWSPALRLDRDHIEQINTNQDSPRPGKRIDGLRKGDCFLFLAGGRLWAEQADSGYVIKTIIPRKYHAHRGS